MDDVLDTPDHTEPEGWACERPDHELDDDRARCSPTSQNVYQPADSRRRAELSSGKQLTKPSDDPFGDEPGARLRAELAANAQYQANVSDGHAWHRRTDTALASMNDDLGSAPATWSSRARTTRSVAERHATRSPTRSTSSIDSIKTAGNTQYAGRYVFAGTKTHDAAVSRRAAPTPTTATPRRSHARSARACRCRSTSRASASATRRRPARDPAGDRDRSRAGGHAGDPRHDRPAGDRHGATTRCTRPRRPSARRENRLSTAREPPAAAPGGDRPSSSRTSRTPTCPDDDRFLHAAAVYQAALRAGASLIQPSLMDFLSA